MKKRSLLAERLKRGLQKIRTSIRLHVGGQSLTTIPTFKISLFFSALNFQQ